MLIKKFILYLTILCFAPFLASAENNVENFKKVLEVTQFNFPRDHGAHPDYKTEWWYFTGHLVDSSNQTYGFELTFFRIGVNNKNVLKSNWAINSIYLGHFAVTDDNNKSFFYSEKIDRDSFSKAGSNETKLNVWIDDWMAKMENNVISLNANSEKISLMLTLSPFKNLILQGDNGLSMKGSEKGQASYYTSFTNLKGNGILRIDDKTYEISTAKAWMDHEVTSSDLAYGIEGWDWFAIQLEDESEIMIYQLRDKNNNATKYSSGKIIYSDGRTKLLKYNEFTITQLSSWKSKKTGITYPQNWKLNIPKEGIELKVIPTVKNQEMITNRSTQNSYWEGRSTVDARIQEKNIKGNAYVELVGYTAH